VRISSSTPDWPHSILMINCQYKVSFLWIILWLMLLLRCKNMLFYQTVLFIGALIESELVPIVLRGCGSLPSKTYPYC
jgi:hypothetical protein